MVKQQEVMVFDLASACRLFLLLVFSLSRMAEIAALFLASVFALSSNGSSTFLPARAEVTLSRGHASTGNATTPTQWNKAAAAFLSSFVVGETTLKLIGI